MLFRSLQGGVASSLQTAGLSPEAATGIARGIAGLSAAGVGAAVGGTAGAASALTIDANNRQLHPVEISWIKQNAKIYATQQKISEADAEKQLAQQAFRQVQFGVDGSTDTNAQAFLRTAGNQQLPGDPAIAGQTVGYIFKADPIQKTNPNMYASAVVNDPAALAFYAANGISQPSTVQILAATSKDAGIRNALNNATLGAGALAIAVTLPTALSYCLTNPIACNRLVIAGGEIAAGDALGPLGLGIGGVTAAQAGLKSIRSAEEVNAGWKALGKEMPWSPGTPVIAAELKPGTKVQMVVSEAELIDARIAGRLPIGGWATFDDVTSQAAARQNLALLGQFKSDVKYVIEYVVVKPIEANIGFVGKQTEASGQLLRGGFTQAEFNWAAIPAGANRSQYLQVTGVPKLLPSLGQ